MDTRDMEPCIQTQEAISRLLDGALDAAEEAAVRAHMENCAACRELYGALSAFSAALREEQVEPPETLRENVMATLRREQLRKRNLRWRRALVSVAAVAALALGLRLALPGQGRERTLAATVAAPEAARGMDFAVMEAADMAVPEAAEAEQSVENSALRSAAPKAERRKNLAALLEYLAGEPFAGEPGAEAAVLTLGDGTLTLCGPDGALRYLDPATGEWMQTGKTLEEIEEFCGS